MPRTLRTGFFVLLLLGLGAPAVAPTATAMHACFDVEVDCLHSPENLLCPTVLKRVPPYWNALCAS